MTKEEVFYEINMIQDYYIDELIKKINSSEYDSLKKISFTSPTGTGKTKMMSKLINRFPEYYFIVTTLSKGQLQVQVRNALVKDCVHNNFRVYGSVDYKINSLLEAKDIIKEIPDNTKCIWLRDEGHIKTSRFDELLIEKCFKIINFSATNVHSDIVCNFTQTMMLRTVEQINGTPEEAINKLLEVKRVHEKVLNYNPCAIFRCTGGDKDLYKKIVSLCKNNKLLYIDITDEKYDMSDLCLDDNQYDVIINKYKLVEGIDIRRAHVLFMENQPTNITTTIQAIGRCRRNALLYRDDIDIMSSENSKLLEQTRKCYVYYNVEKMKIDTDEYGELQYAFCNHISCESLKAGMKIQVINGQLLNGLYVTELEGKTGTFSIIKDVYTGCNIVDPITDFYDEDIRCHDDNYIYVSKYRKIHVDNIKNLPLHNIIYDNDTCEYKSVKPYYRLNNDIMYNVSFNIPTKILDLYMDMMKKYSKEYIFDAIKNNSLDYLLKHDFSYNVDNMKLLIREYLAENSQKKGLVTFCKSINSIDKLKVRVDNTEYLLREICSENEIVIASYSCIQMKINKISFDVRTTISEVLEQRKALYDNIDYFEQHKPQFNLSQTTDEMERIFYILISGNYRLFFNHNFSLFDIRVNYPNELVVEEDDVYSYFDYIYRIINVNELYKYKTKLFVDSSLIVDSIIKELRWTYDKLANNIIPLVRYDFSSLFENVDDKEEYLLQNKYLNYTSRIAKSDVDSYTMMTPYNKIYSDMESSIIGVDIMKQIKDGAENVIWRESTAVSSKVGNFNKLNSYISKRYGSELESAKGQCFTGHNDFKLDKKCNSIIGYCVEYYSKYLVYGEAYLHNYIEQAKREMNTDKLSDAVVVRACMIKYRIMMILTYGQNVARVIKAISAGTLLQDKYRYFIDLIVELGNKTALFVKRMLYPNREPINNIDPNLSIKHITGLADYITEDTILDIKVKNNIDEKAVRQVLAYHYLSTKRSDLHINRVIVYDATSDKSVVVNISDNKGENYATS